MVKNSKEELDFTEFRLMSRTEKDYNCRRILTVFEKVMSFLDFKKIKTKRTKTHKNKGAEDRHKSIYIETHSSYEAERIPEI